MEPHYDDGLIQVYQGDCREILSQLDAAGVDLLLTDPPYGQRYRGRYGQHRAIAGDRRDEAGPLLREVLRATSPLLRDDAHVLVFTNTAWWPEFREAIAEVVSFRDSLIWHKARGGMGDLRCRYALDYEVVLYGQRGRARSIAGRRDGAVLLGYPPPAPSRRSHPTEKPVPLLRRFIEKHCPPGGLVLDPFMGSGSTLVAAREAGRRAIGIELDAGYVAAAVRRLRAPLEFSLERR